MKFDISEILRLHPYSLNHMEKAELYKKVLSDLTQYHYQNCNEYQKILRILGNYNPDIEQTAEQQPMIPVRLFKHFKLCSVPDEQIVKIMTSSGTSGQEVSRIFLDKTNARNQTRVLTEIITSFIGKQRLPLLILDTELIKKDRSMFSARGAGIIGFTTFGKDVLYALDEDMNFKFSEVKSFLDTHSEKTILIFGYTYMIWEYVIRKLEDKDIKLNIEKGKLFHIGGWKKLKDQAVSKEEFNDRVEEALGNLTVHNYYGMAEQLGSVFVECEYGHMHCSNFSDVIIRRPENFTVAEKQERGLIELLSLLPTSYPGHILLTEDEGEILGEDDCPCGRKGKYFNIHGRVKGAEIRGCSDTYEKR